MEKKKHKMKDKIKKMPQMSVIKFEGSNFSKYQRRIVGSDSFKELIKHEMLISLFGDLPGSAGLFLRKAFYRRLFQNVGKNVTFGKSIAVRHPTKIIINDSTIIDDFCVLDSKSERDPGIIIGKRCLIGRNTTVSTGYKGYVKIGSNVIVGANSLLQGPGGIDIGDNVLMGDQIILNAGKHIYSSTNIPIIEQGITMEGIVINDDVWIGAGAIVTDGVTISKGAVIEAGSVVNMNIPEYAIAAGTPAKVITFRNQICSL